MGSIQQLFCGLALRLKYNTLLNACDNKFLQAVSSRANSYLQKNNLQIFVKTWHMNI